MELWCKRFCATINSISKKCKDPKDNDISTPMFMYSNQKDTSSKQTIVSNKIEIFSSDNDSESNWLNEEFSIEELLVDNKTNSKHWSIEELNIDFGDRQDLLSDSEFSHRNNQKDQSSIKNKYDLSYTVPLTYTINRLLQDSSYNADVFAPALKVYAKNWYEQKPNFKAGEKHNPMKLTKSKEAALKSGANSKMLICGNFSTNWANRDLEKSKVDDKSNNISAINPLDNTIGN